jgi:hypothetical protein
LFSRSLDGATQEGFILEMRQAILGHKSGSIIAYSAAELLELTEAMEYIATDNRYRSASRKLA